MDGDIDNKDDLVPLMIVSGAIGAGRTELIRAVASFGAADSAPIVVISHRFGEEYRTTPPPFSAGGGQVQHHSIFDFNINCPCLMCEPGTDLKLLLRRIAHGDQEFSNIRQGGLILKEQKQRAKFPLRGVIIETTGTSDPASFARLLFEDDIADERETAAAVEWRTYYALRQTYALRSIVAVFDARRAQAQLAEADQPGAPNSFRAQILSADTVVLSHIASLPSSILAAAHQAVEKVRGLDSLTCDLRSTDHSPLDSSVLAVDDLRDPPASVVSRLWDPMISPARATFNAGKVLERCPSFFCPDTGAPPCPWQRVHFVSVSNETVVSAPLTPHCLMESGYAFRAPLQALAATLSGELKNTVAAEGGFQGVERFKGACIDDSGCALFIEGGLGWHVVRQEIIDTVARCPYSMREKEARHCGALELEASNFAMVASRDNDPGGFIATDEALSPVVRLFVVSRGLHRQALRDHLRACMVPSGFYLAADEELDFGVRISSRSNGIVGRGAFEDTDSLSNPANQETQEKLRQEALQALEDSSSDDGSESNDECEQEASPPIPVVTSSLIPRPLHSVDVTVEDRELTIVRRCDGTYFACVKHNNTIMPSPTLSRYSNYRRQCPPRPITSCEFEVISLFGGTLYVGLPGSEEEGGSCKVETRRALTDTAHLPGYKVNKR